MATRMHPARLERELARRGWNATDLAKASGISVATISAARHGRPVANATLRKIAGALLKAPVIPGIDDLLGPAEGQLSDGELPDTLPALTDQRRTPAAITSSLRILSSRGG